MSLSSGKDGFEWLSDVPADCPFAPSPALVRIFFTGRHSDYRCGDTIYPSWASDGNLYTPWTDGTTDGVTCNSGGGLKNWQAPWGQPLRVPGQFNVTVKGKDVYIYPEGDTTVPPSGHMPEGGYFFDSIIRQQPIDEDRLNPDDNTEEFGPISPEALAHFAREVKSAAGSGRGVIANFGGTAFGDIALVPGPFMKFPKGIRDVEEMNDWIHQHTTWKTFKHSCGAVEPFMAHFIKAGFDIINPVQCSATGMDPQVLKATYGDRLVFWGGGVDTQKVLPFGTPAQVREQVLERCKIFSASGGFVFDAM
ncbi:MAG TPA: hypothetical protein DCS43_04605 [Verrucomicrobia bacterium]|nr:hypothetical protein [Verrucomicrobiota bacterium]